jgi:hypothetical protein
VFFKMAWQLSPGSENPPPSAFKIAKVASNPAGIMVPSAWWRSGGPIQRTGFAGRCGFGRKDSSSQIHKTAGVEWREGGWPSGLLSAAAPEYFELCVGTGSRGNLSQLNIGTREQSRLILLTYRNLDIKGAQH